MTSGRPSLPQTSCSGHPKAPLVAAAALRCLARLPDLCSPSLLIGRSPSSAHGPAPSPAHSNPRCTMSRVPVSSVHLTGLLPILLRLAVRIAQTPLLHPSLPPPFLDGGQPLTATPDRPRITMATLLLYHLSFSLDTSGHSSEGLGCNDSEISSTSAEKTQSPSLPPPPFSLTETAADKESCVTTRQRREWLEICRLVGWTRSQTLLAGAVVDLLARLAGHRYPATAGMGINLAASDVSQAAPSNSPTYAEGPGAEAEAVTTLKSLADRPDEISATALPDSSVSSSSNGNFNSKDGEASGLEDNSTDAHSEIDAKDQGIQSRKEEPIQMALNRQEAEEWYRQVASAVLALVRHEHPLHIGSNHFRKNCSSDSDDACACAGFSSTVVPAGVSVLGCCLAAITLVSRALSSSPLALFAYHDLRSGLVGILGRVWRLADLDYLSVSVPSQSEPSKTASQTASSQLPGEERLRSPLAGMPARRVCLAAIQAFVLHDEPAVGAFCVKTMTPQVFRWLYSLTSLTDDTALQSSIPTGLKRLSDAHSVATITPCLSVHLGLAVNAAIELAESLVDLAEASCRQSLLLLLLPLLASLLQPPQQYDATNTGPIIPNSLNPGAMHWLASAASASPPSAAVCSIGLHLISLRHLLRLAPRFPSEFRSVAGLLGPELRGRMEAAVRHAVSKEGLGHARSRRHLLSFPMANSDELTSVPNRGFEATANQAAASSESRNRNLDARPTIQLKTDFSNFK
ncbi:unnamed protein product [Protopolystoma xenopodis]|uniref:Uncharacterized protein n=1 Tax=Protopolystoma xenopodis TaxID=117903 RepID=A0A448W9P0_9PLAT|nr:unnamed protein product [Protopolystoma xenopodis]